MNLHFLHGFLGHPSDWSYLKNDFCDYKLIFHKIESFMSESEMISDHFISWAKNFNTINKTSHNNILIGYSLGGRLALHAIVENPHIWKAAIIISAHPGLVDTEEKEIRYTSDKIWAEKFKNNSWENVIVEWNNQPVFSGTPESFIRQKEHFNLDSLTKELINFSLAKQENLRSKIKNINTPILWLAGEKDIKFSKIISDLSNLNQYQKIQILEKCAHRVPWENKQLFINICKEFILSFTH